MRQAPAWKRSFDRWSEEETHELIKAWAPLYIRRRRGTKDAWVPLHLHIRGRARSSRALVTEEWRAVAFAVNMYHAITARPRLDSCRTHVQCKDRVKTLKRQYVKGQAGPFFSILHAVWADEIAGRRAGAAGCRGAPAGNAGGTAAAGDAGRTAPVAARGGAFVHEDCRAAAVAVNSSHTADHVSSKRAHKQCRGRVKPLSYIYEKKHDAVFDASVGKERGGSGDTSGGASVDRRGAAAEAARRRATFVPPPIPKRPRSAKPAVSSSANMAVDDGEARVSEPAETTVVDLSAQALAAGFVDAAVVTKLAEIYKELRMKVLHVEREKAAAAHAGAGSRA